MDPSCEDAYNGVGHDYAYLPPTAHEQEVRRECEAVLAAEAHAALLADMARAARERGGDPEDPDEEEGRDPWWTA